MDLRTRIIINSEDQSRAGFDSVRSSINQLERQLTAARTALLGFFGISLGSGLIRQLADTADQYAQLQAKIRLATKSQDEFSRAQSALYAIAQRTRGPLEGTVGLFSRLNGAILALGGSQERTFNVIELVNKSVAISGVSATTASAGIEQFNQAMASGALRGQEFNSVMLNTPGLAQAIADGLGKPKGKLRAMAEAGELSAAKVIQALESQAGAINANFSKITLTVDAALTNVHSAWTRFIGQLDQGAGASRSVAAAINQVAQNMQQVIETGLALGKILLAIYGAKFISSLTTSTALFINNALAQRQAAAASQLLMQQEIRRAEIAVASSLRLIQEAQLQRGLAATEAQRVAAMKALDAAYKKHEANVAVLQAQHAALNATMQQGTLRALLFGNAVGALSKAMALLNRVFGVFIAWEIGDVIGKWLTQFEKVRLAGSYVAEAFTLVVSGFEAMLKGLSVNERFEQIKQIHAEYDRIRANSTDTALAQNAKFAESEAAKAKAAEASAQSQKESFGKVQQALKNHQAVIQEGYDRDLAQFEQTLAQKRILIDASEQSEAVKQQAKAELEVTANQDRLARAEQAGRDRLAVVDRVYRQEIEANRIKGHAEVELDLHYAEERKSVLQSQEKVYQDSINQLIAIEQQHRDAALGFAEQIAGAEQRRSDHLRELTHTGLSEEADLALKKKELAADTAQVKQLIAEGEYEKAAELSKKTEELAYDIAKAEKKAAEDGSGYSFQARQAQESYNQTVDNTKTALAGLKDQESQRANAAKQAAAEQSQALDDVQSKIKNINDTVGRLSVLNIQTDDTALDATIDKINRIPTDKTITIHTVTESGAPVDTGADTTGRSGGEVVKLARGGWPRLHGRLPGFGGGDKVRALLEAGEWVVRKEAVKAIEHRFGSGSMAAINQGRLPVQPVIQRAVGGPVDFSDINDALKSRIFFILQAAGLYAYSQGTGLSGGRYSLISRAQENAGRELRSLGLGKFIPRVNRLLENSFGEDTYHGDSALGLNQALLSKQASERNYQRQLKYEDLLKHLFDRATPSGSKPSSGSLSVTPPRLDAVKIPPPAVPPSFNAAPASSMLQQAAGKTFTVRFTAPSGASVSGQFGTDDADKLLKILKESGSVSL